MHQVLCILDIYDKDHKNQSFYLNLSIYVVFLNQLIYLEIRQFKGVLKKNSWNFPPLFKNFKISCIWTSFKKKTHSISQIKKVTRLSIFKIQLSLEFKNSFCIYHRQSTSSLSEKPLKSFFWDNLIYLVPRACWNFSIILSWFKKKTSCLVGWTFTSTLLGWISREM